MSDKIIATNRKASFNYHLSDRMEAGMVLTGSEVKSCREGGANISDAYAMFKSGELWLVNAHISPYANAGYMNHEPKRERKLLLHGRELERLLGKIKERGLTLVPTKIYFSPKGKLKIELALGKGKKAHDKRDTIKKRENATELRRAMKRR